MCRPLDKWKSLWWSIPGALSVSLAGFVYKEGQTLTPKYIRKQSKTKPIFLGGWTDGGAYAFYCENVRYLSHNLPSLKKKKEETFLARWVLASLGFPEICGNLYWLLLGAQVSLLFLVELQLQLLFLCTHIGLEQASCFHPERWFKLPVK